VLVSFQALCGLLHFQASFGFTQIPHDGEYMELCYVFQFLFQCDNTTQHNLGWVFYNVIFFNVLEFVLINNKKLFLFDKWLFKTKMDLVLSRDNPLVAPLGHWFGYCIS
jgi:hypothetical protein